MALSSFVIIAVTFVEIFLREKFVAPVGAGGFLISTERCARISNKIYRHHKIARARLLLEILIILATLAVDISTQG